MRTGARKRAAEGGNERERKRVERARDQGRGAREEEGGTLFLEPGGNPPDPPLQAWLAGGGEGLGPVMQKNLGQASTKISLQRN